MMPRRTIALCALVVLVASHVVRAQDAPITWGKIPTEHLTMTSFPADTNAAAVILADFGTIHFNSDFSYAFERHRRIKILSEAGFDWGTHAVTVLSAGRTERVREVRAQTFFQGADGRVEQSVLSRKDVFQENVDGRHTRVRFTLPALRPGSVIEYRYIVDVSSPYLMPEWTFQTTEPTLWSEFRAVIPPQLNFVLAKRGMAGPLWIEETTRTVTLSGRNASVFRAAMKDVTALREEPYMTTPNDYLAAIQLQLSEIRHGGYGVSEILHTWDEVAKQLRKDRSFGQYYEAPKSVRTQVTAIVEGAASDEERLRAIYDYIRTNITWNGGIGVIPDQKLDALLKTKLGSRPDVAALLASMLRETGIEADPVLISTRSHGVVLETYPLMSQFNDVIIRAAVGEQIYLLDATDPLRPIDLLPFDALNGRGWMVGRKEAAWIDVVSAGKFEHSIHVEAAVRPDGGLELEVQASDAGYSALEGRTMLHDEGQERYLRDRLLEGREIEELGSYSVEGTDANEAALRTRAEAVLPDYAIVAGELIYFNPKILGRIENNPFRLAERTFPVDFGYPRSWSYTLTMDIPAEYVVEASPPSARIRTPKDGATYQRIVTVDGAKLTVQTTFNLSKAVFWPEEYKELRKLYERIVALESEQLVLKRKPVATVSAGEEQ